LYQAKNGKYGGLIVSREQADRAVANYVALKSRDGLLELASLEDFQSFLLEESSCGEICHMTQRRVKKAFEDCLRRELKKEFEEL
jgi:hypothetical protein